MMAILLVEYETLDFTVLAVARWESFSDFSCEHREQRFSGLVPRLHAINPRRR
jgi:hypothetical protein